MLLHFEQVLARSPISSFLLEASGPRLFEVFQRSGGTVRPILSPEATVRGSKSNQLLTSSSESKGSAIEYSKYSTILFLFSKLFAMKRAKSGRSTANDADLHHP